MNLKTEDGQQNTINTYMEQYWVAAVVVVVPVSDNNNNKKVENDKRYYIPVTIKMMKNKS